MGDSAMNQGDPMIETDGEAEARFQALKPLYTATLNTWGTILNSWAEDKGWNEKLSPDHFDGLLALMHSELSEALEEWRNGHAINEVYYVRDSYGELKPEGIPIELADCLIRILHTMAYFNINIEGAMLAKHKYNMTRPYRHGGKRT